MAIGVTGATKPGGSPAVPYFGATGAVARQQDDEGTAFAATNLNTSITASGTRGAVVNNVNAGPQIVNAIRANATNRHMVP